MKAVAAVTVLASVAAVHAASLIPSGISTSCSAYYEKLNNDTSLASCTSSLITATSSFVPSLNASAVTPTSAQVKSALSAVCSSTSCSESTLRSTLASFYEACTDDITGGNSDVVAFYDVLYTLTPFKTAICSKDDNGDYCVSSIASTTGKSASDLSSLAKSIATEVSSTVSRRADAQEVLTVTPNAATIASNNILFLMLQPTLSKDALCQSCTRQIITSYISYESKTPYAPGLAQSVFLAGQSDLYSNVTSTCGSSFLSGGVAAAAGLSGGIIGGDDSSGAGALFVKTGVTGTLAGLAALALGAF